MTRPKFRRCFISAPFGADTTSLRQALEEKGIRWSDQTSLTPGTSWLDVLTREISRSDFVCAVVPMEREGNILFELGIAYAKGKPILAFVASTARFPADIYSLTYVRSDAKDPANLRLALNAFLEHASTASPQRKRTVVRKEQTPHERPLIRPLESAIEAERQTANLLRQAGFLVSESTERKDQGADFAIWIDELEHSLGNPLLVEVKAGDLSSVRLRDAAARLRHYVSRTHGRCALLIYWDRANREFPAPSAEWPLVLQLSGPNLNRLVLDGKLVQELVRLRNAAVHGGS
jgi:nucleoside 2-deoxyribosyltransferase